MSAKRPSDRAFGLVFAAVFGLIAVIGWLVFGRVASWAIAASGTLASIAAFAPSALLPVNRIWARLGHRVGVLSNALLLGAFFYLVVTPFGLLGRLFRQLAMPKRPDPEAQSYWTRVRREVTAESYVDMF